MYRIRIPSWNSLFPKIEPLKSVGMVDSHIPVAVALSIARAKDGCPLAGEGRDDRNLESVDSLVSCFPALAPCRAALQVSLCAWKLKGIFPCIASNR